MQSNKLILAATIAFALLPVRPAFAADNLQAVLQKLDAAAASFHTASADFEFDTVQTQPVPDTDVQKGAVYYERNGAVFQMGLHINEVNGQPVPKVVVCCQGGGIKLYEKLPDQVTTLSKLSQYQSWFMLGFGASGRDLEDKFDIKYLGQETIDGINTAKLELVPKDPAIRNNVQKMTLWMDTARGVSLKQIFYEGSDQYRVCVYFNIRINQPIPADAFTFKTDKSTTYVSH